MSQEVTKELPLKSIVSALWTGNLFAPFLLSGVAAMLPAMGTSLFGSAVALSLVMVCYNLGQGISHVISGRICSQIGVRRVLLGGIALFSLLSALLGFAVNMPMAIGLRFAQGVSAAAISCCVTSISVTLAPPDQRGKVISTVVSAVYLGLTLGPLTCGALTELASWRAVFFLIALLGAMEFLFLYRVLPGEAAPPPSRPINMRSVLLMVMSLTCITFGATCTFLHPLVWVLFPCGIVLLAAYIRHEWRSDNPLLNFRILGRVPGLSIGMTATFINYGSFMGLSIFFSLYLQQILGLNAFEAGMVLMTQSTTQVLFSPVAGRLADRYEPNRIYRCGMALVGASIMSMALLNVDSPVWHVVLMMGALGLGVAFFVAPCMSATLGNVPREHLPIATGLLGCLRTLGGLTCHIIISAMLGLFLGDADVGAGNKDAFISCMRCAVIFFGIVNISGVLLTTKRLQAKG